MGSVPLEEAQAHLAEWVGRLRPGESLIITQGQRPVATLTATGPAPRPPRQPGSCRGMLTVKADDDDHLADFAEYMG